MTQFTIRDVLWLMVVVGIAVGWCVDHALSSRQRSEYVEIKEKYDHLIRFVGEKYESISLDTDGRWHAVDRKSE